MVKPGKDARGADQRCGQFKRGAQAAARTVANHETPAVPARHFVRKTQACTGRAAAGTIQLFERLQHASDLGIGNPA